MEDPAKRHIALPACIYRQGVFRRLFFLLPLLALFGCRDNQGLAGSQKEQPKLKAQSEVSQAVGSFALSSIGEDGVSSWRLKGQAADLDGERIDLKNVEIKSSCQDSTLTMKAKNGSIRKDSKSGLFTDDVVLAYDDGTTFNTDSLDWSFEEQAGRTDSKVFVKSAGLNTRAEGASLKRDSSRIQLDKNILMRVRSGAVIRCKGPLIIDYKQNTAVFNRDVQIESANGNIRSDRMTAFFDMAGRKLNRVKAQGNVRLTRGGSVSTSDRAEYFLQEGRAILTGNPEIFIDSREAGSLK